MLNKLISLIKKHKTNKKFILFGVLLISLFILVSASLWQTLNQSDFDEGTYNQTYYNTTNNAVQINLSYDSGNYTSKVFNAGSTATWDNLSWHEQRIQCPEGMVYINKLNGFCIDKYEASCWNADGSWNVTSNTSTWASSAWTDSALANGAYANSSEGKYPWVYIDQTEARTACANYPGGQKHLCTDEEWLASANIKGVVYNLDVTLTDCTVDEATDCDWANSPGGGDACMTGSKADCVSSELVYDMVGNVREWTNETVDVINPVGNDTAGTGTAGWYYANNTQGWQTTTGTETAIYGNDGCYFPTTTTGRAVSRGGPWTSGANAGPFYAALHYAPTDTYYTVGFRCCSS